MEGTYFDLLPKELYYVVLYNCDIEDIFTLLGYNFYECHRELFNSIIKRDFGKHIRTDLIDVTNLSIELNEKRYNHFRQVYNRKISYVFTLKVKDNISLLLCMVRAIFITSLNTLNIKLLDEDGTETINVKDISLSLSFYIERISTNIYIGKCNNPYGPYLYYSNLNSLLNFLFFFDGDTIFRLKKSRY